MPMPRRRRPAAADFYRDTLSADERARYSDARAVRGLVEEIALLRVKLRSLLLDTSADPTVVLRAFEILLRAVTANGRLPVDDTQAILERVSDELGGILTILAEQEAERGTA
jgi:hypothetical protein